MVIILIATVGYGGNVLFGLLAVISLIGMSELYKVVDVHNKALGIVGYLVAAAYYALLFMGMTQHFTMLFIIFLVLIMAVYVFSFPTFVSEQVMTTYFGLFYVAVMLSYVYQTRSLAEGGIIVWLIFLSSWGCDTCAYCVGMLIGKHKMAAGLSPKKSVGGVKMVIEDGKLVSLTVGGEPLDDNKVYVVATNSFLLNGGDGLFLSKDAVSQVIYDDLMFDAMLDSIKKMTKESKPFEYKSDGRIIIVK